MWKKGEITPVHKKECTPTKGNYRPRIILPSLSYVFETLIHSPVSPWFSKIFHKNVFANHKHHGCNTALLSLTEQWCKEVDNRQILCLVSMDLKKLLTIYLPHELTIRKFTEYVADNMCAFSHVFCTRRFHACSSHVITLLSGKFPHKKTCVMLWNVNYKITKLKHIKIMQSQANKTLLT